MNNLIPKPVLIEPASGAFALTTGTHVYIDPPTPDPRLAALGVNFYRAPEVGWQP